MNIQLSLCNFEECFTACDTSSFFLIWMSGEEKKTEIKYLQSYKKLFEKYIDIVQMRKVPLTHGSVQEKGCIGSTLYVYKLL